MSVDDENVVPFPRGQFERRQNIRQAALDDLPVRKAPWTGKTCDHRRAGATVDEQARVVRCRGCNVELDPIEVLAALAGQREQLVFAGMRLRDEVDSLTVRVERLRKDEANAKARIRKARSRQDDDEALRVAAQARPPSQRSGLRIGGYRPWEELSAGQQEVVVGYVRLIVEAYRGALDEIERERQTA